MKGLWDKYLNSGNSQHEVSKDLSEETSRVMSTLDLSSGMIDETVSTWMSGLGPEPDKSSLANPDSNESPVLSIDRVLTTGLNEDLFSEQDIRMWDDALGASGSKSSLSWRHVFTVDGWRRQQLERLAARVYGFRSVLVCQMSSLVLADLLTARISPKMWADLFEMRLIPVVEHGNAPLLNGRILCISQDPSDKSTREYVNSISQFQAELAYADGPVVSGLLDLVSQHIPAVGAAVQVSKPILKKVGPSFRSTKRAA